MGQTYKVLGQVCPTTTGVLTTLYTVPATTSAVVSSIVVTDVGNAGGGFAVSVAVAGAADNIKQYLYGAPTHGLYIDPLDTFAATMGITLAAGDVVRVKTISGGTSEITYQLFGSEIT